MQNFMKTIISAVQTWTKGEIKDSTADWNENDSSADSYVKNRTHWEEMQLITLLPEMTVVIEEDGGGYVELSSNITRLTIGQEYHITLNGVEYACVAREWNEDDSVTSLIGNGTICGDGNEGNGEPFSCDSYEGGSIYLNAAVGEYTISISTSETVVHKIDEKYLPKLASTPDWNQNDPDGDGYIKNRPFYEETKYVTYIEEQTVTLVASGNKWASVTIPDVKMPWDWVPYKVTFDGVEYEGIMTDNADSAWISIILNSGETLSVYSHGYVRINSSSFAGDHTIKVEQKSTAVTTIENKYLGIPVWQGEGNSAVCINNESNVASGYSSHAEGDNTIASGGYSHAEGRYTKASSAIQHVQGKYNIEDTSGKYAHIVGNGTSDTARSNAHTLDWDGNAWFQGAVKIGGTGQDDEAAKEVATKEYVDNAEFVSYNPQTLTDEQKAQVRANIDRYVWHTFSDSYGTYTYTLDPTKNFNYELAQTVANTSNNGSISALEDIVSWLSLLARCSYATPGAYNEVIENVAKNFDAIKNSGAGMSLSFYYQHTGHNGLGASVDVGLHPEDGYVVVTIYNGYADFHASFSYNSETNTTTEKYLNRRFADKTLSKEGYYADAKAVGDAISQISSQNLNLTVETVTIGDDSGEPENVPVTGVSLDLTSYSAKVGDGFYINPVVSPSNATNKVVTWKSSATNIATVNNSGYVECITEGNAVITCTTVDGGFTATCAVSVSAGESGGDDSGGGDTTGGKVYFKDSPYTLVEGSLMKPNGTTGAISHTGHLAIPYTDGITIATCMNPSWNTNTYPHFVVLDNGVYSAVNGEATGEMATTAANQFVATFTGYGAGAVIYANMNKVDYMKTDENMSNSVDSTTFYYYTIPGGEN